MAVPTLNFTPPDSDWTVQLLNQIFGPGWQTLYLNASQTANSTVLDAVAGRFCLLMFTAMMAFFLYTSIVGSYATAHEGKALGKRYHWAYSPIRGVSGFALMAPLGPKGLCALQALILYFVSMGIGIADDMWKYGVNWIEQHNGQITTISTESPTDLAPTLLKIAILQEHDLVTKQQTGFTAKWKQTGQTLETNGVITNGYGNAMASTQPQNSTTMTLYFLPDGVTDNDAKSGTILPEAQQYGTVSVPCPPLSFVLTSSLGEPSTPAGQPNPGAQAFCQARMDAVMNVYKAMVTIAKAYVTSQEQDNGTTTANTPLVNTGGSGSTVVQVLATGQQISNAPGSTTAPHDFTPSDFSDALLNYQATIGAAIADYSKSFNPELSSQLQEFANTAASQGWASAGAWYLQIARVNNDVQESIGSGPSVKAPSLSGRDADEKKTLDTYFDHVEDVNAEFTGDSSHFHHAGVISYDVSDQSNSNSSFLLNTLERTIGGTLKSQVVSLYQTMIQHISSGQDPIGQMQTVGHGFLTASIVASGTAIVAPGSLSTPLWALAKGLGALGAVMAYAIPMTPFVLWLLAIVAWLVMVLECWIAAPVWAFAHGMPEGEGFIGEQARQGYMLFFSVLIKPPLLLLGYFLSLALLSAIMPFVAKLFSVVFAGNTGGDGFFMSIFDMIGYSFIFVTVSFLIVRKCFLLITWVPDNILRWVNVRSSSLGVEGEMMKGTGGALAATAAGSGMLMSGGKYMSDQRDAKRDVAAKETKKTEDSYIAGLNKTGGGALLNDNLRGGKSSEELIKGMADDVKAGKLDKDHLNKNVLSKEGMSLLDQYMAVDGTLSTENDANFGNILSPEPSGTTDHDGNTPGVGDIGASGSYDNDA